MVLARSESAREMGPRFAIRIRRFDKSKKTVHVAVGTIRDWKHAQTLLQGAVQDDELWWPEAAPTAKASDDAWATVFSDERAWWRVSKRALVSAEDWRAALGAWDAGAKERYLAKARKCCTEYAISLEEPEKRFETLQYCWEFAHYAANVQAATDPFLGRIVQATRDAKVTSSAFRCAWMLARRPGRDAKVGFFLSLSSTGSSRLGDEDERSTASFWRLETSRA